MMITKKEEHDKKEEMFEYEQEMDRILDLFQNNPEKVFTRGELMSLTGLSDRKVRNAIRGLRLKGIRIISRQSGGYLLASVQEYIEWRNYYRRYAYSIFKAIGRMDKKCGIEDQVSFKDIFEDLLDEIEEEDDDVEDRR